MHPVIPYVILSNVQYEEKCHFIYNLCSILFQVPVTVIQDSSSPESTDSNSLNGDVKKKKKRKLFSKLMKGSSEKQKTT